MLEYLDQFDPSQPYYLGKHVYIGDVLFGHGASGFVISNPGMKIVSEHWREHRADYDRYPETQWTGDMILGKVIKDVGIDMLWAFPHLQGDSLTTNDWNVSKLDKEPWCYAPTTFHHMNKAEISIIWRFEQEWYHRNRGWTTLRFCDIFKGVVYHQLKPERSEWDNLLTEAGYSEEASAKLSDEERNSLNPAEREAYLSFEKCKAAC